MLMYACNKSRGFILTSEAILSLLVLLSLIPLVSMISTSNPSSIYEFVVLSDAYEVLEKKYHGDVDLFIKTGIISPGLASYFEYLHEITGLNIFISFRDKTIPVSLSNCNKNLIVNRLFMSNSWHELHIGTCDKN